MTVSPGPLSERTTRFFPPKLMSRLPGPVKTPAASMIVSPGEARFTAAAIVGSSPEPSAMTYHVVFVWQRSPMAPMSSPHGFPSGRQGEPSPTPKSSRAASQNCGSAKTISPSPAGIAAAPPPSPLALP